MALENREENYKLVHDDLWQQTELKEPIWTKENFIKTLRKKVGIVQQFPFWENKIPLSWCFSNKGNFISQEAIWYYLETFSVVELGRAYWHLMD